MQCQQAKHVCSFPRARSIGETAKKKIFQSHSSSSSFGSQHHHHQRPTFRSIYWKTRWRRAASAVWQVEEKAVVAGSNRSCCCCTQPPPPGMVYTVVDVQCYNGCVCSLESGWALAGERTHTPKQAATIPQQGRILKKIPGGKEGGGKRNPTKK